MKVPSTGLSSVSSALALSCKNNCVFWLFRWIYKAMFQIHATSLRRYLVLQFEFFNTDFKMSSNISRLKNRYRNQIIPEIWKMLCYIWRTSCNQGDIWNIHIGVTNLNWSWFSYIQRCDHVSLVWGRQERTMKIILVGAKFQILRTFGVGFPPRASSYYMLQT